MKLGNRVVQFSDSSAGRAVARRVSTVHGLLQNDSSNPHVNGEHWILERLGALHPATYFDVGANVGAWTALALETAPAVTVHAFEPIPSTFAALQARFAADQRVRLHNAALTSSGAGHLRMWFDSDPGAARSSAVAPVHVGTPEISVIATSGDEYLTDASIDHVDLLKVDVEGHELAVLAGFADALSSGAIDVVQFEFTRWAAVARHWLLDYAELFDTHGYRIGKLFPRHIDWKAYDAGDEQFLRCNFVAVRPDSAAATALGWHR